jgi:hypothetical protein
MPPEAPQTENTEQTAGQSDQDDLIRQIAERVWELWQQELRLERERRGDMRR